MGVMNRLHRNIPTTCADRTHSSVKPFKKRLLPVLLSLDFLFIKVHKHPCQSIPIDPLIINMPNWSSTSPPRPLHSPSSKVRSGCQSALFLVFFLKFVLNCSGLHLLKCWLLCREEKRTLMAIDS